MMNGFQSKAQAPIPNDYTVDWSRGWTLLELKHHQNSLLIDSISLLGFYRCRHMSNLNFYISLGEFFLGEVLTVCNFLEAKRLNDNLFLF